MNASAKEVSSKWKRDLPKIGSAIPGIARGFGAMHEEAMKAGSLSTRDKELMAMAIGLVAGCNECVISHMQSAIRAGATRQQIVEAAGVAVLMGGGPAFVHMPVVLDALDEMNQG